MAPRTRAIAKRELAFERTRGFAALPIELLHNVVSHMQEPPIPHRCERAVASVYRERRDVLLALCQLCRSLRTAFLPLLWERLEACAEPARTHEGRTRAEVLARELTGQLRLVTNRRKKYASYVRIVNVVIESEYANSMKHLADAMDLMPNLHTIQIISEGYPFRCGRSTKYIDTNQFLKAFERHGYPSVRRAILPVQARYMLASLPAVVDVFMNSSYAPHFPQFAAALAANCPVESLGWQIDYGVFTSTVVEHLPNIRRVECHVTTYYRYMEDFKPLSKLRNLEKLTITVAGYLCSTDDRLTEVIEAARKALAASPRPNKCLEVVFMNENKTLTFDY